MTSPSQRTRHGKKAIEAAEAPEAPVVEGAEEVEEVVVRLEEGDEEEDFRNCLRRRKQSLVLPTPDMRHEADWMIFYSIRVVSRSSDLLERQTYMLTSRGVLDGSMYAHRGWEWPTRMVQDV